MLQIGDLCYIPGHMRRHRLNEPQPCDLIAMYVRKLPDAIYEKHVVYAFSTGTYHYVHAIKAITLTEL